MRIDTLNPTFVTLQELSSINAIRIEQGIFSLHKLNKEHHLFQPIKKEFPGLKEAEYVMYPNGTAVSYKIFLNKNGKEVLKYEKGLSEFVLSPCDIHR